ncbi:DUF1638 domain-containing protein [Sporomusa termitida]|uniref:DUF1638 domain-containing protein n=1 Tax=Sporomusa termitida TaxID=2377 RepID=A0A517DWB2_9FIRM|nr:DUF1638 domain-containing protein [Sporomusa termitida]QDR81644.1 hypothetical protein SPTER_30520 [Sporomusa termitida]
MRIKLIGCQATKNEVTGLGLPATVDCEFLDFSWHAFPDELHQEIQRRIDASQNYDLIILTYGRCSHALAGLVSASVPMVVPAAHDCVSLLLGSDRRRQQLSARNPAVYYFSQGWLKYGRDPYAEYQEYLEKYGEEDALYLIQTLYGKYEEAVFIRTCEGETLRQCRQQVNRIAGFFNWKVSEVPGDLALLAAVVNRELLPDVIRVAPGNPIIVEEGNWYADQGKC